MSTELDKLASSSRPKRILLYALQPILDIVLLGTGDGIDVQRRFGEVFEDEDKIELPKTVLHTLQGSNLDLIECDHEEWRV